MSDVLHYRVTLSYACFGIEVERGYVTSSAPIGRWMIGKSLHYVIHWVHKKKGRIEGIGNKEE